MKVTCETTSSINLGEPYYQIGYTHETKYDLTVGKTYFMFAQCLWKGCLLYLLDPTERCRPSWYPASLFQVADTTIPSSWKFTYFKEYELEGISAIWGYAELIQNEEHFDGLSERNAKDLEIFCVRKLEMQNEEL